METDEVPVENPRHEGRTHGGIIGLNETAPWVSLATATVCGQDMVAAWHGMAALQARGEVVVAAGVARRCGF